MTTPTATRGDSAVQVTGLDGTRRGPALRLVRSALDGDISDLHHMSRTVDPRVALASCLDLLLDQAHWTARRDREQSPGMACDSGAAFLLGFSRRAEDVRHSLVAAQVAADLLRVPHATAVAITPISVFAMTGLVLAIDQDIEEAYGHSVLGDLGATRAA